MNELPQAGALLPLDALWPTVAAQVTPLPAQDVLTTAAAGRVLAAPAAPAWDLPPFTNSAMDGWAVRAADVQPGVPLPLTGAAAWAGAGALPPLPPGQAMPIGTGGPLPPGADAILCKEEAAANAGTVTPLCRVEAGAWIRRRGGERNAGDVILPAGTLLRPASIGALAAAGVETVQAARAPLVAVLATGNEVAPAGASPGPGRIADANTPLLGAALAQLLGHAPPALPPAPDDAEALRRALATAWVGRDVLVVTGGVSVGDRDLVKAIAVDELGAEPVLWRVAVKPGKPVFVARRGAQWLVALPGNPSAVAVHWHLLLRPLLLALQGAAHPEPAWRPMVLAAPVRPDRQRDLLRWCTLEDRDGVLMARPVGGVDSHMLGGAAVADALVRVAPGAEPAPAGTPVPGLILV